MADDTAGEASEPRGAGPKGKKGSMNLVLIAVVVAIAIVAIVLLSQSQGRASNSVTSKLEASLPLNKPMGLAQFSSIINGSINAANQSGSFNGTYAGSVNVSINAGALSFSIALPFNETEQVNGNAARLEMIMPLAPLSSLGSMFGGSSAPVNTTVYVYAIKNGTQNYLCVATTTQSARCVSQSTLQSLAGQSGYGMLGSHLNLSSILSGMNVTVTGESATSYNSKPCELFTGSFGGSLSGLWNLIAEASHSAALGQAPTVNGTMSICISSAQGPLQVFNASVTEDIRMNLNQSGTSAGQGSTSLRILVGIGLHETSSGGSATVSSITSLPGPLTNGTNPLGSGGYGSPTMQACIALPGFMCTNLTYSSAGISFQFGQTTGQDYYGNYVFIAAEGQGLDANGIPVNYSYQTMNCGPGDNTECGNTVSIGLPNSGGGGVLTPGQTVTADFPASLYSAGNIPPYTSTEPATGLATGTPFAGYVWLGYCLTSNCPAPTYFAKVATVLVKSSD